MPGAQRHLRLFPRGAGGGCALTEGGAAWRLRGLRPDLGLPPRHPQWAPHRGHLAASSNALAQFRAHGDGPSTALSCPLARLPPALRCLPRMPPSVSAQSWGRRAGRGQAGGGPGWGGAWSGAGRGGAGRGAVGRGGAGGWGREGRGREGPGWGWTGRGLRGGAWGVGPGGRGARSCPARPQATASLVCIVDLGGPLWPSSVPQAPESFPMGQARPRALGS